TRSATSSPTCCCPTTAAPGACARRHRPGASCFRRAAWAPPGRFERNRKTMATLRLAIPGKGAKVYRIHKKITSLGRSEEADAPLPDAGLADSHVHIHFDGREFNLATTEKDAEVFVNGKKKS